MGIFWFESGGVREVVLCMTLFKYLGQVCPDMVCGSGVGKDVNRF